MNSTIRSIIISGFLAAGSLHLGGCAALLAPKDKAPPDLRKVQVGASRAEVEQEFGKPLSEMRAPFGSAASRKCTYQFLVRHSTEGDLSFREKMNDAMLGFHQVIVTVFYDNHGRVVRVASQNLRRGNGDARLIKTSAK